jgi:dolichol-phosphate mannosyltransferase
VIVPTRNEASNLLPVLALAYAHADELLVIDGHSTDGTREIATACGARVIIDDQQGKGAAIRRGIAEAQGDILVFIDADGSHDPADIPALVAPILAGEADHVSGSRMLGGSDELHATIHQFVRLFGSQVITLSINYTLGVRLTDCQNGFRAIRREVAQQLHLQEDITTIEQEMIIKSVRLGYRLREVATHEYARANGQSNFRVQDVWHKYLQSFFYYLLIWQPAP